MKREKILYITYMYLPKFSVHVLGVKLNGVKSRPSIVI